MARLLERQKFRAVLKQKFPVIFIDEYQDTDRHFMEALTVHLFAPSAKPQIGLFGDHWQTIYRNEYTLANFLNVEVIGKESNFRSAPAIVDVLNRLRPELPQKVSDPGAYGEARFFHVNAYTGERTNTAHSKADLPDALKGRVTEALKERLIGEGWDFAPDKTKVLMLTHNALAAQQGYATIAGIFDRNEAFAKKEDPTIAFIADTLEPMVRAYAGRRFGEMFRILGGTHPISRHASKVEWRTDMDRLSMLRTAGTIGDVLDHLKETQRPRLPDNVASREDDIQRLGPEVAENEEKFITRHRKLRDVQYSEVVELVRFLEGYTPFATQHSVKGAEFQNVLVLLGGGWNHYNWPQFLELLHTQKITEKNVKGYHRARNLFYVAISRPKVRLAVLATQTVPQAGLQAVAHLFGRDAVVSLEI
jgi:DNA helicase-2/ATP-dependent DNA helicase PcrA